MRLFPGILLLPLMIVAVPLVFLAVFALALLDPEQFVRRQPRYFLRRVVAESSHGEPLRTQRARSL